MDPDINLKNTRKQSWARNNCFASTTTRQRGTCKKIFCLQCQNVAAKATRQQATILLALKHGHIVATIVSNAQLCNKPQTKKTKQYRQIKIRYRQRKKKHNRKKVYKQRE